MKFIGITGGVGAGKSAILGYLAQKENTRVMLADEIAHELMEPGTACYDSIRLQFAGEDIFLPDGHFDRGKMAKIIFSDEGKRMQMNRIVHPAVRRYVIEVAEQERAAERERLAKQGTGGFSLLVLEAALLIEEKYDEICDELWYIYTKEEVREDRLMQSRGYSREKVRQIFSSQLGEEIYRSHCRVVIDNNGTVEETFRQIDAAIEMMKNEQGDTAR